eukprot:365191-Chlamydomonas_euryale.AAC.1
MARRGMVWRAVAESGVAWWGVAWRAVARLSATIAVADACSVHADGCAIFVHRPPTPSSHTISMCFLRAAAPHACQPHPACVPADPNACQQYPACMPATPCMRASKT